MARDLHHDVRIRLDDTLAPETVSVTTFEDERVTYRVDFSPGPFDTLADAVATAERMLATQLRLW